MTLEFAKEWVEIQTTFFEDHGENVDLVEFEQFI
jgi:hypothetical protein